MAQTYFDILLSEQKKRPKSKRNDIIRDAACSHGAKNKTLGDENLFPRSFSADEGVIVKAVPVVVETHETEPKSLNAHENSKEYGNSQSVDKVCTPVINKVPGNLSNLHQRNFKRWISNDLCSFDDTEFRGNSVDEITKSLSTSEQVNYNEIYVDTNQQINENEKIKPNIINTPLERTNSIETMHQKTILDNDNTSVPITNCISIDLPSMSSAHETVVREASQISGKGRIFKSNSVQETPLLIRSPLKKFNSVYDDYNRSPNECSNQNDKISEENAFKSSKSSLSKSPELETQNKKYERFIKSYSINEYPIKCKQVESADKKYERFVKSYSINEYPDESTDLQIENEQAIKQILDTKTVSMNEVHAPSNQTDEITTSNSINKHLGKLSLENAADEYLTNTGIDLNNVVKLSETLQNRSNSIESSQQIDEEECSEDLNHIWPNAQNRIAFYENMRH